MGRAVTVTSMLSNSGLHAVTFKLKKMFPIIPLLKINVIKSHATDFGINFQVLTFSIGHSFSVGKIQLIVEINNK